MKLWWTPQVNIKEIQMEWNNKENLDFFLVCLSKSIGYKAAFAVHRD